ncbi:MAG: adenylate/guanylate cyclase domain-containing protein [Deltaproteobacteria bacterium]|nr:adenylate/guanylate cyclase domain-containing protein [Deltaproteobacteria bacterium]
MRAIWKFIRLIFGTFYPFRGPRTLSLWIAGVFAGAVFLSWRGDPPFVARSVDAIEEEFLRLKFNVRGYQPASSEVVIAAIDELSLERFGQWPWDRRVIAQLIETLKSYGARTIAFDMVFSEDDRSQGSPGFRRAVEELLPLVPENGDSARTAKKRRVEAAVRPLSDEVLAQVLAKTDGVVLGYFLLTDLVEAKNLSANVIEDGIARVKWSGPPAQRDGADEWPGLPRAFGVVPPIRELASDAKQLGFFNAAPSSVLGMTIHAILARVVETAKTKVPLFHLAATAASVHLTGERPSLKRDAATGRSIIALDTKDAPLILPTDFNGEFYINYRGPRGMYKYFGASSIIDGTVPRARFKDKLVLVGVSTAGLFDRKVTPYAEDCPGVEINATIADNILTRQFLQRPPKLPVIELAVAGGIGLVLGFLLPFVRRASVLFALLFVLLGGLFFADVTVLFSKGVWVKSGMILLQVATTFVLVYSLLYFTHFRKERETRHAFQHYLAKPILEVIMKDPSKLALGGERREVTVLFTDIRGFTSFSETCEATRLGAILNEYLTPMTNAVFKNGGTLDKYIGDAMMAFFGAPVEQSDHARRACQAAIEIQEAVKTLETVRVGKGEPAFKIGVGLNSGVVSLGNMGSQHLFNYTVLGDEVNLGSRLEGTTKYFGAAILASGRTVRAAGDAIVSRFLGRVRVVGREEPIEVFEPLAMRTEAAPALVAYAERFGAAVELYQAARVADAKAAFEVLVTERADDATRIWIARCDAALTAPSPEEWDGVIRMAGK